MPGGGVGALEVVATPYWVAAGVRELRSVLQAGKPHGGFHAGAHAELFQQAFYMDFNGALGDVQLPRDHLVGKAVGHLFQHLPFPLGEFVEAGVLL